MPPKDAAKWARAHAVQKQQLKGAEAAAVGRPLRVPKGMWKRGGGKAGKTANTTTHFESAYQNWVKGRDRALAGGYLSSREEESYWCRFAYYSTLQVLELLGDAVDRKLVPPHVTPPDDSDFAKGDEVSAAVTSLSLVRQPVVAIPETWTKEDDESADTYLDRLNELLLAGHQPPPEALLQNPLRTLRRALRNVSMGAVQHTVDDATWEWANNLFDEGWTVENGAFKRRAAS